MFFTAKPEQLKKFREAKKLSQVKIAEMLNMEQTTYSKKELGKSTINYQTALAISDIIEKKLDEFLDNTGIINNITDTTLTNSSVNGDVTNNLATIPNKIIKTLEDLILLIKDNFKSNKRV